MKGLNLSPTLGILLALAGIGLLVFGLNLTRIPNLCDANESHIICLRSWLGALGPIIAAIALLIAFAQFSLARQTSNRQLRAYVGTVPVLGSLEPDTIEIKADNQGQTPAYKVVSHLNWQWQPFGKSLPSNFKYPDYNTDGPSPSVAVIQSKDFKIMTVPFDKNQIARVRNKETSLFLYGHVDYEDVFGGTHSTHFAYEYHPAYDGDKFVGHTLVMLPNHNEAD